MTRGTIYAAGNRSTQRMRYEIVTDVDAVGVFGCESVRDVGESVGRECGYVGESGVGDVAFTSDGGGVSVG